MKCQHGNHYDTKAQAKRVAKSMGLDGAHKMQCNGKTVYMPGKSHSKYANKTNAPGIPSDNAY